jgi:hypothetical protein
MHAWTATSLLTVGHFGHAQLRDCVCVRGRWEPLSWPRSSGVEIGMRTAGVRASQF